MGQLIIIGKTNGEAIKATKQTAWLAKPTTLFKIDNKFGKSVIYNTFSCHRACYIIL
jgi:hypothetical protein